ncbi:MAG: DUF4810 domain-containing protein [Deltaproteobacteria bacterium]|nr:DUF4810 domain-containing protein [Deltaproteobacteria bacterium]
MKKHTLLFGLLLTFIFFAGCVKQKMYYFGNYSNTLYNYQKNQNEESLISHKQELEKIIAESKTKNLRVPPGIYAELGYIHLKANKVKEAIRLFNTESHLYPESKHLMDRLIQNAETKTNSKNNN